MPLHNLPVGLKLHTSLVKIMNKATDMEGAHVNLGSLRALILEPMCPTQIPVKHPHVIGEVETVSVVQ